MYVIAWQIRSVMLQQLSWSLHICVLFLYPFVDYYSWKLILGQCFLKIRLQMLDRQTALSKDMQLVTYYLHNCALHSEFTSFTINYGDLTIVEIIEDMHRFCRTHMAKQVCAWCSNRNPTVLDQQSSVWMLRCSYAYKTCLGCHHQRQKLKIGFQYDCQWSWPKLLRQYLKNLFLMVIHQDQLLSLLSIQDMDYNRISERAFFSLINAQECLLIISIGSQSIYSLGWECHKLSLFYQCRSLLQLMLLEYPCFDVG